MELGFGGLLVFSKPDLPAIDRAVPRLSLLAKKGFGFPGHHIAPDVVCQYRALNRASVSFRIAIGAVGARKKPAFAGFLGMGDTELESVTSTMST
ncbi:hypothetical protein, partial [Rhodopirellula bahusiensis]|uniref:hypothetical protein n=1 Tax=Rhodopirellula bahusiensis TaxID=2014065 RepID=UPI003296D7FE